MQLKLLFCTFGSLSVSVLVSVLHFWFTIGFGRKWKKRFRSITTCLALSLHSSWLVAVGHKKWNYLLCACSCEYEMCCGNKFEAKPSIMASLSSVATLWEESELAKVLRAWWSWTCFCCDSIVVSFLLNVTLLISSLGMPCIPFYFLLRLF